MSEITPPGPQRPETPSRDTLSSPELQALGFDDRLRALFAPYCDEGLTPARVLRADRGSVLAGTAEGVVRAEPSPQLRRDAVSAVDLPSAGDWVALDPAPSHEVALVRAVLPRSSAFMRGDPGKTTSFQVLAANVDAVFVVQAIDTPPNLRRIERELALVWDGGAVPVVVLSKADLSEDPDAAREAVEGVALGVDVHVTSATGGQGVPELLEFASGRTVALIGPSGAGKSTLLNALVGADIQATREVRVADGKGRHTTVARELVPLPGGGVLVDTPGMRALAVTDADDGIAAAFPDIASFAEECRFRDCTHDTEPGCGVLGAVERGELSSERLESWRKLRREAQVAAMKTDARLKAEETRKWKIIHKSVRDHPKYRGRG